MIKILIYICILLSRCNPAAFAQTTSTIDVLPDTKSSDSLAILNNDLRQNQNAINAIGAYFGSNGTLQVSAGGTGANTLTGILQGNGQSPITGIALTGNTTDFLNGTGAFSSFGHGIQLYTSSGTFIAPAGVTKVYLTMSAGGGGGGGAASNSNSHAGGGASGQYIISYPYTVTPGNTYTVTVGALGAGGLSTPADGSVGGDTSFDTLTLTGGNGGLLGNVSDGAGGLALVPASTRIGGILGFSNPGQAGSTSGGGGGGFTLFGVGGNGGVTAGDGGTPTSTAAAVNTGAGGGGAVGIGGGNVAGSNGGSGIVIIQY